MLLQIVKLRLGSQLPMFSKLFRVLNRNWNNIYRKWSVFWPTDHARLPNDSSDDGDPLDVLLSYGGPASVLLLQLNDPDVRASVGLLGVLLM